MNDSVNTKVGLPICRVVCYVAVITFGLVLALPRYRNGIDLGDEGFLAYSAVRVWDGQIPNRDFVSLQPPLSFYTVAAVFKLFGTSLITLRTLGLCIYLAIILLVYAITSSLTGPVLALMAAMLAATIGMPFFNFTPFAVWHGIAASLLTIYFILKFTSAKRRRWAFLSGVTTALTILSRHDQGVYLVVAVLTYVLITRIAIRKKSNSNNLLGFWAVGTAAIILPLTMYWTISGALPYMFRQLVISPLTTYAKTSSLPFPVFKSSLPLHVNLFIGLMYLSPTIEGLMAIWLITLVIRGRFNAEHSPIAFILIVSVLFYCQVLIRSDIFHFLIVLPPFFILLSTVVQTLSGAFNRRWMSTGIKFVMLAIIVSLLLCTKPVFLPAAGKNMKTISLERGGVKTTASLAGSIEHMVGIIQKYSGPDEPILCLPYHPMFYFLSERCNPTRWNYIWPGDQTAEDYKQLIEQAEASRPAVVVLVKKANMIYYAPAIVDYVNRKYKMIQDDGTTAIYLPADHIK